VEGLEPRDLPSGILPKLALAHQGTLSHSAAVPIMAHVDKSGHPLAANGRIAHVDSPNGLLGRRPAGPFLNPKVIQHYANVLYGPNSVTPMTPTPREVQRQIFTGRWIGEYTIGLPRFSDRSSTIHAWSKMGGSDQFLKGKLNLVLFQPADPGATPTPGNPYANQITGIAGLFPQNLLQSSAALVLDLNGTPGTSAGVGPSGLPTHLTWSYDNNASAGPYAAPIGFLQGAGTLDIQWVPDAHPLPGTMGSGKVVFTFQGLINGSQLVSPISKVLS
jgi:hypothetical protein